MSSSFTGNTTDLLPQTYIIPEDPDEKDLKLRQYLNNIARATNTKDSGIYNSSETVTGQQFLPTFSTETESSATYRGVLRKVIDFGALPDTGTKSVPHGIIFTAEQSVTRLYGAATEPGLTWYPLPYAAPVDTNNIELNLTATTVNIVTGRDRTNFTRCFVVVEWISIV